VDVDTSQLQQWFSQNLLLILVIGGVLLLLYAYSGRIVPVVVRRTLHATEGDISGSGIEDAELVKRASTIESLATTLIRLGIISLGVLFVVGITGTWGILTAVGLFLAAIALAGQAIVMDYLMGILIIVEAQFFKGDNIEPGNLPWTGTVEDVGLRRTVVRGADGTVYSISNGELRTVANRTRIYAAAEVRVRGVRQGDLQAVVDIMQRVGASLSSDPAFEVAIIEAPTLKFVDEADEWGSVAVMRGKVIASERWRVASELRLRLDQALSDAGIKLNRRSATHGGAD
jgi:small conductance mechanosensitive channel